MAGQWEDMNISSIDLQEPVNRFGSNDYQLSQLSYLQDSPSDQFSKRTGYVETPSVKVEY